KKIKVISIAKRYKELFIEGIKKPILLKTLPQEIFNLIISLDDEAHRFAITYHKKLRKKYLLK
ncbi:MAG: excinuclease ABC subunit C, partial [Candidatus Staskawiczbacteria bacterium]|nr:excinuclease ABC subunit C [Candidatus Staskawiczbacteria bacterium]